MGIQDSYCYKGRIYFLGKQGGLFEYDILNGQISFLGQVEGNNDATYMKIHPLDCSTFLFVPYYYGNIVKYKIEKKEFQVFYRPDFPNNIKCMPWKKMFQYKEHLFFLGLDSKVGMLIINLTTGKARIENGWKEEFKREYGCEASLYFNDDVCQVDSSFWITLNISNMIMQYNMETGRSFFYKIGEEKIEYATICFDGKYFWLSGGVQVIVRWDRLKNETVEYRNFPSGFIKRNFGHGNFLNGWDSLFLNSLKLYDRIYFSPLRANMLVALNLKNGEMTEVKKTEDNFSLCPLQKLDDSTLYYQEQNMYSQVIQGYCISYYDGIKEGIFKNTRILCSKEIISKSKILSECFPSMLIDYIESIERSESSVERENVYLKKWKNMIRNI